MRLARQWCTATMENTDMNAEHKDKRTKAKLQHRHFAFITQTLKGLADNEVMYPDQYKEVCTFFAKECAATNPRFDHARFMRACGVLDD
jgi:citrate synthase